SPRITTCAPISASTTRCPSRLDLLLPNMGLLPFFCRCRRCSGLLPIEYLGGAPRARSQRDPHTLRGEALWQHHTAGELLEVPEGILLARHLGALVQLVPADRGQLAVLDPFHREAHLPLADRPAVQVLGQHHGVLP